VASDDFVKDGYLEAQSIHPLNVHMSLLLVSPFIFIYVALDFGTYLWLEKWPE
jgi:hypothetical protein